MPRLFETVTDLSAQAEAIRRRPYGVIEVVDGRLVAIRLRPWPKFASLPEVLWSGQWRHRRQSGDRFRLFYNQPWRFSNYLTLAYVGSTKGTTLRSMFTALAVLDEIARIKRSDAILTDVANFRISDRLLAREGWCAHKPSRWHRHYIKRFYGEYPPSRFQKKSTRELTSPVLSPGAIAAPSNLAHLTAGQASSGTLS